MRWLILILFLAILSRSECVRAQNPESNPLEVSFQNEVLPFLQQYCLNCHGPEKSEGGLDLTGAGSVEAVVSNYAVWEIVQQRLEAGEMPPKESQLQPSQEERQTIVQWLHDMRTQEASRNAGDPGIVLARRLSNSEFDNTIRDLIGFDIKPTKEFPVDPANEAGFDNSGESLSMSPALLTKYLAAVRHISDHAVLTPRGILFAPHPAVSETDHDKFCVQRIIEFYQRHEVSYSSYFLALWKFQLQHSSDSSLITLESFARESALSPKYLALLWETLHSQEAIGPQKELMDLWTKMPDNISQLESAKTLCEQLSKLIGEIRADLEVPIERLKINGVSGGSQPLILWWNQKVADGRMTFPGDGDNVTMDIARDKFCQVFPSAFSVSSRGHYSNAELGADVRLLSAGFHLMQGYFRDDQPLCELVLNDVQKQELEDLWADLNFVTLAPIRQYKDFLFFERAEPPQFAGDAEFDFARPENKDVTSVEQVMRLRDTYLKKVKAHGASEEEAQAVDSYFMQMNDQFRWIEQTWQKSEFVHLDAMIEFAERAWRRPVSLAQKEALIRFYRDLRGKESLSHEEAIRDSIASILMSPFFSYRFDMAETTDSSTENVQDIRPLTNYELASRLSYFLWASMPDQELLSHAARGDLDDPKILAAQARRMLKDPKIRGLATEFSGHWLEFRRFEEHNAVDRKRFPSFDNELRSAMFEEPVRFFMDLTDRDGSLLELLSAGHTFVNRPLAMHYGFDVPEFSDEISDQEWVRFENAATFGRGGLLPMSVFLTKNSPGLRTSPVKRGYWVVRRLLGEHIPAPPPDVPELPKDEAAIRDLSLTQLLAKHRDNAACAGCHQRFDSIGLAFEGYGPIGERRNLDLGGHPVQTQAIFPDGSSRDGFDDLRQYLITNRQEDFMDNFVRKLFAFALGRTLLLSDSAIIEATKLQLSQNEYRFSTAIESIVTSPQFLNKRMSLP